jgi:hypothetical protein
VTDSIRYPCPCCGYVVFVEPAGSFDICPICFWEDDNVQLRWPDRAGGANSPSLIEAQRNFVALGAKQDRSVGMVRDPASDEPIEPGWRPVDPVQDLVEASSFDSQSWPEDLTVLYYWRPTYWHRRNP